MASKVLKELTRRKVVQVAIGYAVAGFGVIQADDAMLPNLGIPSWGVTLVAMLVVRCSAAWRPLHPHPRFQVVFQQVFPGRELPTATA